MISALGLKLYPEVALLKRLPEVFSGFDSREIEAFSDSRYGASAGFRLSDKGKYTTLTIILFDGGQGPISDGIESNITNRASNAAINDIRTYEKRGFYKDVVELKNTTIELSDREALYA